MATPRPATRGAGWGQSSRGTPAGGEEQPEPSGAGRAPGRRNRASRGGAMGNTCCTGWSRCPREGRAAGAESRHGEGESDRETERKQILGESLSPGSGRGRSQDQGGVDVKSRPRGRSQGRGGGRGGSCTEWAGLWLQGAGPLLWRRRSSTAWQAVEPGWRILVAGWGPDRRRKEGVRWSRGRSLGQTTGPARALIQRIHCDSTGCCLTCCLLASLFSSLSLPI